MNYRIIALLSVYIFTSAFAVEQPQRLSNQDIAQHAQFWASKYVPELNHDEITLLTNILHFNAKLIDEQIKVGNAILFAYVHAGMINNLVLVSEDDAKNVALASAVALRKLKEEYLPARKTVDQILKHALQELQKPEFSKLDRIMNEFNEYGQAIISQFTLQDSHAIETIITECQTAFNKHAPTLAEIGKLLDAVAEHRNPHVTDKNVEHVVNLQTAIYTAENAITLLSDMINNAIRIKRMTFDIMNISKTISQIFYQTTLHLLEQEKRMPVFIMFNEEGIIAPEDRWQDLPKITENK